MPALGGLQRIGRDYSAHPWASPFGLAFRYAESLVKIRSRRIFRTLLQPAAAKRSYPDLDGRYKNARARRAFLYLAEREGFEPSVRLNTVHSLSRRARSTTPAPLQKNQIVAFGRPAAARRSVGITRPVLGLALRVRFPLRGKSHEKLLPAIFSNPRYGSTPYTHFPGEPVQPLRHLSRNSIRLYALRAGTAGRQPREGRQF